MRIGGAWAAALLAGLAGTAGAETRWRVAPAASLAAGADDNVLFDNQGGDAVARGAVRLRGRAWDRRWHLAGDVTATGLGYGERQRLVFLGETTLQGAVRVSRETRLGGGLRVRAADDPLALAQIGLVAGKGRTLGFRASAFDAYRLDRDWRLLSTLHFDGVRFLDQATAKDGQAVGLAVSPIRRLSRELSLEPAVEGRLFLQGGVVAGSVAALPGVRWRLARRTFVEASAGPLAFTDTRGTLWMPVARARVARAWREAAVEVVASHDLTVPVGRGGVLAGELLEAMGRWSARTWEVRGRAGLYRSHPSPRDDQWVPGYGLEAGVFGHVGPGLWLGLTALRFERLATDLEPALARDALYVRLDFTGDRP